MRQVIMVLSLAIIILIALLAAQSRFTYVGASKCAMCHRTEKQGQQYLLWEKSKHPTSFQVLSSPQTVAYAQSAGLGNPTEIESCLKCHAPLYKKAPELKAEGVTCEVCHGPGSEYSNLNVMKDRELAQKNGLVIYPNEAAIKKLCLPCHENAHGQAFVFTSSWEKIKHPVPRK